MKDAQARQEGVSGESQTSSEEIPDGGSETTSQEEGQLKIDPAKEYLLPDGKTSMLGLQLLKQMGRGALADEWQSKSDQANVRLQQFGNIEAERDAAFEQLAAIQRKQEMEQVIQERMPPTNSQVQTDDGLWNEDGTSHQPTPVLNPQETAQLITDIVDRRLGESNAQNVGDINALVNESVQQVYQQQEQNRVRLNRDTEWAANTRKDRIAHYMTFGMSEQDAANIADKVSASQALELEGRMAHVQGGVENQQAAHAAWQNSTALRDASVEDLAAAMLAKREADRVADLQQQLETGQLGGVPATESEGVETDPSELWTDRVKAKLRRQSKVDTAADRHDAINQARNALGNPPG